MRQGASFVSDNTTITEHYINLIAQVSSCLALPPSLHTSPLPLLYSHAIKFVKRA